jgi:hypothetical protein
MPVLPLRILPCIDGDSRDMEQEQGKLCLCRQLTSVLNSSAELINWLSPINFFRKQADISQTRQPGTGEWLLTDSCFQEWQSGLGRTLWCHGICM